MSIRQSATGDQIAQLLEFLEDHRDLARGSLRGPDARIRAKKLWDEVTNILNSLGGAIKTAAQWQKVWADRKHLVKKSNAKRNRDHTGTGGGPAAGLSITNTEEKILSIMGDNFGGPQTLARVPAFLSDENQPPDSHMVVEHLEEVEEEVVIVTDHDYFNVPHCSSQPPQPLARTPLAPVNTSASQPPRPLARTPLAPVNTSASQPPRPLARTPLAPVNTSASQPPRPLATTPLAPVNTSASQPPRPLATTPLAPVNTSASQPPRPLATTPLAPVNTSASQLPDQLVRTPLAPADNSTRRRLRNTSGRGGIRSQPNVARRILDAEEKKVDVMVDIKNALVGILHQLETMNSTMLEIAQVLKDK